MLPRAYASVPAARRQPTRSGPTRLGTQRHDMPWHSRRGLCHGGQVCSMALGHFSAVILYTLPSNTSTIAFPSAR